MTTAAGDGVLVVGSVGWHLRGAPGAPGQGDDVDQVQVLLRDRATGLLGPVVHRARVAAPGYLCLDAAGTHLYAVSDLAEGRAVAMGLSPAGELELLGEQTTGGESPCHLALVGDGRLLVSANYADGSFSVHGVEPGGELTPLVSSTRNTGSGPEPSRQAGPHAHMAQPSPDGRWVVVVDLGTDQLLSHAVRTGPDGPQLSPSPAATVQMTPGSGPRHVVFGRGGRAYTANELAGTVSVLDFDAATGRFTWRSDHSTLLGPGSPQEAGPSAVILSEDLAFLLVANRFRDAVAVFDVREAEPAPVGEFACGGTMPRDMVLADGHLYVTNAASEQVAVLGWEARTGRVGPVLQTVPVPAASSVVAAALPGPRT